MTASVNYNRQLPSDVGSEDELEWVEATVENRQGQWQVLVDNSLADEGYVSLRLNIVDGQGTQIEQRIDNLYAVDK